MSGINGDKSRFHRQRKQKIQRRARNRKMVQALLQQSAEPAALEPKSKPKEERA